LAWLFRYRRAYLAGDLMAGIIVTIMLVPQSMAYAMLAGLPPEIGLYASVVPLGLYGVLGTSRTLAVGPVAIASLLVATGVSPLAEPGSAQYVQLALVLALLAGLIQVAMGLVRLGFLVNFMSHPVLAGFTSAAAILIGFSQVKHLVGIELPRTGQFHELLLYLVRHLGEAHGVTLGLGLGSVAMLVYFRHGLGGLLRRWNMPEGLIVPLTRSGPLVVVVLGTLAVSWLGLQVGTVGDVPAGLPSLTWPAINAGMWRALLPIALTISFVGYMESMAVAKRLASKRREKVDANRELVALGAANLGAAFTGGYPVTGGFSRSAVNFAAGARTPLASIVTAGLIGIVLLSMTPLFYFLPKAVLAAIIVVAVAGLVEVETFKRVWHYSRSDAASMGVTFLAVLALGVEVGILVGIVASVMLLLWRMSQPHVAVLGRVGEGETFRNVERHIVQTCAHVVAVRVDESFCFANAQFLEETLLEIVAERPDLTHLVLEGAGVNFVDASALEALEALERELAESGVQLHLAAFKGPVMDRLRGTGLVGRIGGERVFFSAHEAFEALGCG
jgi:SulP family sulfate permease